MYVVGKKLSHLIASILIQIVVILNHWDEDKGRMGMHVTVTCESVKSSMMTGKVRGKTHKKRN